MPVHSCYFGGNSQQWDHKSTGVTSLSGVFLWHSVISFCVLWLIPAAGTRCHAISIHLAVEKTDLVLACASPNKNTER